MKNLPLIACAALFLGCAAAAVFGGGITAIAGDDTARKAPFDRDVARAMGFNSTESGTIIYEEVPQSAESQQRLEDIAPAAGDDEGHSVRFIYDPLTQTFRRTVVDRNGNSSQDVINTNSK